MVMPAVQQAVRPTSPPIPNMEQAAPVAPATAARAGAAPSDLRSEVRNAVRDAVRDAVRGGQAGTVAPPDFPGRGNRNDVPTGAVVISVAFFGMFAAIFILGPVARAFARRMDRKGQLMQSSGAELAPKIAQLQDSVDAMAIELERISEGQRFTTRLMSERAAPAPAEQQRLG